MKHTITIEIDTDNLRGLTDQALANLWHVTQANPAPIEDRAAGEVAEHVGREIIRRFVTETGPELWAHQGRHADWCLLHLKDKETTRNELTRLADRVKRLGNLFEGPDGCGTEGTDLADAIASNLRRLSSMEHAGMDRGEGGGA